ncbi:putative CAAX prenyl protease 2, partial [Neolecta irregularis DAH-3]
VLYILPSFRPNKSQTKDDPSVIKRRFCAVCLACLLSFYITSFYTFDSIRFIKLWPVKLEKMASGVYLTLLLFSGPLFEWQWADKGWKTCLLDGVDDMACWIGWRNYVVGPFTEEFVFRGCIVSLFVLVKSSECKIIFLTPFFFGIAHLHHFYEFYLSKPELWRLGIFRSVFQFSYTTIFGWYAVFLFLRLETLWAPVIAHAFCNVMGLPRLWGRVNGGLINTVAYYLILISGMVGFIRGIVDLI